jgi:hypothetical protein
VSSSEFRVLPLYLMLGVDERTSLMRASSSFKLPSLIFGRLIAFRLHITPPQHSINDNDDDHDIIAYECDISYLCDYNAY